MVPASYYVGLSAALFVIGVLGVLVRRDPLVIFMSIEIMLNAVNVNLAVFGYSMHDQRGQIVALFVIAVAAAEAAVGLGLLLAVNRNRPGVSVEDLTELKW